MTRHKLKLFILLISALAHLSVLLMNPSFFIDSKNANKKRVKITVIKRKSKTKKQIVNSEDSKEKYKETKNAFLSDRDRFFKKQTKAKNVNKFQKGGQNGQAGKKRVKLSDLSVFKNFNKIKKSREMTSSGKKGLASNNDFLEDVPVGTMTGLNTKQYKFFGFYDRIRRKLEQYWGNSIRKKAQSLYRSGRRIKKGHNYITSLQITLDNLGNIVQVVIVSKSGNKELDAAAVESFNKAGPFPNPPRDLIKNGHAIIEWGFVVKS